MIISFHGAAQTVTGSKHLITLPSGKKLLLDCGMFQGRGEETDVLNRNFGFNPAEIDYMLLSHAHIDHSGLLPRLVANGFNGKIYCTPPTFKLSEILLKDSAHIQQQDTIYINKLRQKQHKTPIKPLYSYPDVENCLTNFIEVPYNEPYTIANQEVTFTFTDAGHILGSAVINLTIKNKGKKTNLCFSGDVGRYNNAILKSPQPIPAADYIICESTYGNKLHTDRALSEAELSEIIIHTCINKKGKLIIPAFSIGRTQEILYVMDKLQLAKKLPAIDVFLDSPLSTSATEIVKQHPECFNNDLLKFLKIDADPFAFNRLHYVNTIQDSQKLNQSKNPCIIISASGMAEAGRVKHHIKFAVENKQNTILMAGYCEPSTLGARLQSGEPTVAIFGERYTINAEVKQLSSFSAHGDYNDLSHFLADQDPKQVKGLYLVHGEYTVQQEFKKRLQTKGFNSIEIPAMHQSFNI